MLLQSKRLADDFRLCCDTFTFCFFLMLLKTTDYGPLRTQPHTHTLQGRGSVSRVGRGPTLGLRFKDLFSQLFYKNTKKKTVNKSEDIEHSVYQYECECTDGPGAVLQDLVPHWAVCL